MAGELCGPGCGYCGACDGQYDDRNLGIDDQDVDDSSDVVIEVARLDARYLTAVDGDGISGGPVASCVARVEASSVGLAPGEWPERVVYRDRLYEIARREHDKGEIVSVDYRAADGSHATLRVWND